MSQSDTSTSLLGSGSLLPHGPGSLWRKWDLQIHVPGAKHADQYKLSDKSDPWSAFINYLVNTDVSVFGVTDYYSIEGYKTLASRAESVSGLEGKTFFPCIELRLSTSVNDSLEQHNCHLIFDPGTKTEDIEGFLSKLPLVNKKPNEANAYCVDKDIVACGGYGSVSVKQEDLKETLTSCFGKDRPYLIAGVASGMGSNRATPNSKIKKSLADSFDDFCDLFFGNQSNTEYYLKEDRYEDKQRRARPKPVVATSDCHDFAGCESKLGKKFFEKQGDKDLERYGFSWIKADTTFEGLRQIIHEPECRVSFGHEKPDSKKPYHLIDKVGFIDNTGKDDFPVKHIAVNPNLTTIVGGKSTGKSLLLHYIAKTINEDEVAGKTPDYQNSRYNFDESSEFDFEVVWGDGSRTRLKPGETDRDDGARKILYIPQNYLNKLSEYDARGREDINKFVKSVLLQDDAVRGEYSSMLNNVREYSKSIPAGINDLYQLKTEIQEQEEGLRRLGDESGIRQYLSQLQKEATDIKSRSGLSESDIAKYENLINRGRGIREQVSNLREDGRRLSGFSEMFQHQLEGLEEVKNALLSQIEDQNIREKFAEGYGNIINLHAFKQLVKDSLELIANKVGLHEREMGKLRKQLEPLMKKVKLQDELKEKNKEIDGERGKLDAISSAKKNLKTNKSRYLSKQDEVIKLYGGILSAYISMRDDFKRRRDNFGDLSINVVVGFDSEGFQRDVVDGYLNKQDIKRRFSDTTVWTEEYVYSYDSRKHPGFIKETFESIVKGDIKTVSNRSPKDAATKLLEDYFSLDFKIEYKGDKLDKMSPGKKGLVLLRLLIDLSKEEWPILLDQPEDDLDNRSIYNDMVSFIREKKRSRQILVVTHNPNLVVGSDSEGIVVANQKGQEDAASNQKYKFEYVSGALENSHEPGKKRLPILMRQGIRQHVCEILEGGEEAFRKREDKYDFGRSVHKM